MTQLGQIVNYFLDTPYGVFHVPGQVVGHEDNALRLILFFDKSGGSETVVSAVQTFSGEAGCWCPALLPEQQSELMSRISDPNLNRRDS